MSMEGVTNNSRESLDSDCDSERPDNHTQGRITAGPVQSSRNQSQIRNNLNTSEFMHSRLGLLDNHITINYDLSMAQVQKAEETGDNKPKK